MPFFVRRDDADGRNVVSLFDGQACGLQALKQAGIKIATYHAFEIDKYAIQIAKKNHPEIIHHGEISDVTDFKQFQGADLLIGGSPCQGFSFAGKQLNFNDPRSALFFEFVRAKEKIQPKNFMLENVKMKKEYSDVITKLLDVEPILINSALVSAQNRQRYYWCNWKVEQPEDKGIYWNNIQINNAKNVMYYSQKSFDWLFKTEARRKKFKIYDKNTIEKMQMVEASHSKGYSNQRCFGIDDNNKIRYIHPIECERLQTLPDNYTEGVSNAQRYKMLGNGWTVAVIEHLLRSSPLCR